MSWAGDAKPAGRCSTWLGPPTEPDFHPNQLVRQCNAGLLELGNSTVKTPDLAHFCKLGFAKCALTGHSASAASGASRGASGE